MNSTIKITVSKYWATDLFVNSVLIRPPTLSLFIGVCSILTQYLFNIYIYSKFHVMYIQGLFHIRKFY